MVSHSILADCHQRFHTATWLKLFSFFKSKLINLKCCFFYFKNNVTWNKNTVKSSVLTHINFSLFLYTVAKNPMNYENIPTFPWIINSWIAKFLKISALLQTFSHFFSQLLLINVTSKRLNFITWIKSFCSENSITPVHH